MISPETRVQIRRCFYAEHWKISTIATALNVHPDTVRRAIEVERFQHAKPRRHSRRTSKNLRKTPEITEFGRSPPA